MSNVEAIIDICFKLECHDSPHSLLAEYMNLAGENLGFSASFVVDSNEIPFSDAAITIKSTNEQELALLIQKHISMITAAYLKATYQTGLLTFKSQGIFIYAYKIDYDRILISLSPVEFKLLEINYYQKLLKNLSALFKQSRRICLLTDENKRLTLATKAGGIGTWVLDIKTLNMSWDEQMFNIYEIDRSTFNGTLDFFSNLVVDEDLDDLIAFVRNYLEHDKDDPIDRQFRIRTPNGKIKKIASHARLVKDNTGKRRLCGVNYDITELETARTQSIYRSQLENLIIELSMKVIRSGPDDLDSVTNEALHVVGSFVGADRAYKFTYDFESKTCENTHEWCNDGIAPEINNLKDVPIDELQLWVSSHMNGLPMFVARVLDLPEDHILRQILEPQGVRSLVTIPMMEGKHCTGFIGFDAVNHERHWNEVDISLLKLLADLLVNANIKARNERTIQQTNAALIESRDTARYLAKEAAAASIAKSRFVASVSHEIRTPLHAILGLADLSTKQTDNPELLDNISTIQKAGNTLLELINDVLDFSRSDANEMKIKNTDFSLSKMLNSLEKLFSPLAEKKGLLLKFSRSLNTPDSLIGDELRIKQILSNFLSNALKFTNQGSINLIVSSRKNAKSDHNDNHVYLTFKVIDTGVGITPEDQAKVFDPFYQSEYASKNQLDGTGLGLPISLLLTEKMGGTIDLKSQINKGSTFTLNLSLKPGNDQLQEHPICDQVQTSPIPQGLRVLVAEDNPVNQQLIKSYLEGLGLALDIVANGVEALDQFRKHRHSLILMDCQMPEMDGFTASSEIRKLESGTEHSVIIAVTASALKDDWETCFLAGMDDVLTKPFSKQALLTALSENCLELPVPLNHKQISKNSVSVAN